MGDVGETFRAFKEIRKAELKEQKEARHKEAMELLVKNEVQFNTVGPFYLLVEGRIDYWPTTGRFIDRKTKRKAFGVRELLRHIGIE